MHPFPKNPKIGQLQTYLPPYIGRLQTTYHTKMCPLNIDNYKLYGQFLEIWVFKKSNFSRTVAKIVSFERMHTNFQLVLQMQCETAAMLFYHVFLIRHLPILWIFSKCSFAFHFQLEKKLPYYEVLF